jgi:hypothetical protein
MFYGHRLLSFFPRIWTRRGGYFLISLFLIFSAPPLAAQTFIEEQNLMLPPFNMRWGLVPEDLLEIIKGLKLPHHIEKEDGVIARVVVTKIPQKNVHTAIFHFEENMLWEIELQMGQPTWNEEDYGRFFLQTKRHLDERYGFGRPIVLDRKTSPEGVATVLAGYFWRQFGASIQLYFYQATSGNRRTHILSQHYRPY